MSKSLYSRKRGAREGRTGTFGIDSTLKKDLELYNPTLKSVLKVEELFEKNIEFNSKSQLLRKLDGSMKAPVLNVILRYLRGIGKVIDNEDGSWTWIYAARNKKLKMSFDKAVKL